MAPRKMSEEHKEALAAGRTQGRVVKRYLEALDANRPKRGRRRTPESIQKRLDTIGASIDTASPIDRLQMVQERIDLTAELAKGDGGVDLTELERDFVKVAKDYGIRKGISYAAWREINVPASVLRDAGITRGA